MRNLLRGICCVFFASGVLWANPAAAVNVDGYEIPYAAALYDYEISDGVRDSSNGNAYQITGGWPLSQHGAAELSFFNVSRSRDIDGKDDYQIGLFVNYVHDFGLYGFNAGFLPYFKPYLLAGPGWVHDDVRGSTHDNFGLDAGGGLLFPLKIGNWNWGWAVRTEATAIVQIQSDETVPDHRVLADYHLTVGVQIPLTPLFRRHATEVPPPPECKVKVVNPVTGRTDCLADSDGDGVSDSDDQCPGTPSGTPVDAHGCPLGTGNDADRDGVPDDVDQCPNTAPGVKVDGRGCAIAQTLVLQSVNFESGSAVLTGQATHVLDQIADTLNNQKDIRVEIGGHTDNTGNATYNLILSQQRAESVRQYLIGKGVDGSRLTTQGYGATKPLADNSTEEGRAKNRRVEFKIIVGGA